MLAWLTERTLLAGPTRAEMDIYAQRLNDLTSLENTLGIVLDRWGVTLVER